MRRFNFLIPMVAAVAALGATACDGPRIPTDPRSAGPVTASAEKPSALTRQDRQERLARRLAVALANPARRAALATRLRQAVGTERKIHFQSLLGGDGGVWHLALAEASRGGAEALAAELGGVGALEVYLPVADHRNRWDGGPDLLVATAIEDGAPPVAFDISGRRSQLDPAAPPERPVIALVPAEQPFAANGDIYCFTGCTGGSGGGYTSSSPGLYMTYAAFNSTYEGWLKGNPEFETHVLGQEGSSSSLSPYQCAGERAGGAYYYDQNARTWSGSVMLFSQAQLDAYRTAHPDQALRVLVVEDDDTACQLRTETDVLSALFRTVDAAYKLWTGGKDGLTLIKVFQKATVLQQAISSAASLIKTNDEVVGTAVADDVVGQTWAGANWIVKGDGNITTGGLRLEMR
jgi:hypothetical protein